MKTRFPRRTRKTKKMARLEQQIRSRYLLCESHIYDYGVDGIMGKPKEFAFSRRLGLTR